MTEVALQRPQKYRLYPTPEQENLFVTQGHCERALWNMFVSWTGEQDFIPTTKELETVAADWRASIEWLKPLPAQACQAVAKTYRKAWDAFFSIPERGRPQHHLRTRTALSFDIPQARDLKITKVSRRYSTVNIPLVGAVKMRMHRALPSRPTGARVLRESDGHWYLIVRGGEEVFDIPEQVDVPVVSTAIDRGIAVPVMLANGESFAHDPYLTPGEVRRLRLLERRAARQRAALKARLLACPLGTPKDQLPRSNRLQKTYDAIARIHHRVAARRKDFNHKTSRTIADQYTFVVLEQLDTKNMTKAPVPLEDPTTPGTFLRNGRAAKAALNRGILNEGWAQLARFLKYKLQEKGGDTILVTPAYSSQECHVCGYIDKGNRKSQAVFQCQNPACGWTGNADENAANTLHKRWLDAGAHLPARTPVGSTGAGRRQPKGTKGAAVAAPAAA